MEDRTDRNGELPVDSFGPNADGPSFPVDVLVDDPVFEALAHRRRRYVCYLLLDDAEWSLVDLARAVAALEEGLSPDAVSQDRCQDVYVSLYHSHVPKLVEAGIVDLDDGAVTPGAEADRVLTVLDVVGAALAAIESEASDN